MGYRAVFNKKIALVYRIIIGMTITTFYGFIIIGITLTGFSVARTNFVAGLILVLTGLLLLMGVLFMVRKEMVIGLDE